MAEHFRGRNDTVHFSNSGCESLLRGLIATAQGMAQDDALAAVVAFLRDRLAGNAGSRAFYIEPPPAELADTHRLRSLGHIVAEFAGDLADGRPNPVMSIQWDRRLQMQWLANVLRLYALIGDALPADVDSLPSLDLELTPEDRAQCEIYQLDSRLWRYDHGVQQGEQARDPKVRLAFIDQILAAAERLGASASRDQLVLFHSEQRADLLLELGDRDGAVAAYRTTIALERDKTVRRLLEETVAEIEKQKDAEK